MFVKLALLNERRLLTRVSTRLSFFRVAIFKGDRERKKKSTIVMEISLNSIQISISTALLLTHTAILLEEDPVQYINHKKISIVRRNCKLSIASSTHTRTFLSKDKHTHLAHFGNTTYYNMYVHLQAKRTISAQKTSE